MSRVIHTGQALVDVVVEVPDLPDRGQNVMAASATDYAGGTVTVLLAAARFGAECNEAPISREMKCPPEGDTASVDHPQRR